MPNIGFHTKGKFTLHSRHFIDSLGRVSVPASLSVQLLQRIEKQAQCFHSMRATATIILEWNTLRTRTVTTLDSYPLF